MAEQHPTEPLPEMPEGDPLGEVPAGGSIGFRRAAAKVREFPQTPGVYLMKDAAGRVIYVGKAKNLRARGPAATFSRPPPRIAARPTWSARSATSTSSRPRARSTPCWSKPG